MSDDHLPAQGADKRAHARSFAAVADIYDRARPSYPPDAITWLLGAAPVTVLELGAGTGKLTELLVAAGHRVVATDPLPGMVSWLRERAPQAHVVLGTAEQIPVPSRSIDVVVCAESFHWFDHDVALPEIARVLRPEGHLALVWNFRDEGIPWVRKLGRIIGAELGDLEAPMATSDHFGLVDSQEFRFWQSLRRDELQDLARSRSAIAVLDDAERDELLGQVGELYDGYGRGPDGMQLPYLTKCYRAVVQHQTQPPVVLTGITDTTGNLRPIDDLEALIDPYTPPVAAPVTSPEDTGTLLIDFR